LFKKESVVLENISVERIKQELDKMLLNDFNVNALEDLKQA
jgi:tRNA nucleotidyltransferase/poly(A) polymerase